MMPASWSKQAKSSGNPKALYKLFKTEGLCSVNLEHRWSVHSLFLQN